MIKLLIMVAVAYVIGILCGYFVQRHSFLKGLKPDGEMVVNMDDPKKDIYTLHIFVPMAELPEKDRLFFTVRRDS